MVKLTAVIPTLNEEKDLPRLLKSLKGLADEIVVIDSGSTDNTVNIAQKHQAKVYYFPFKSFSKTRNYGTRKATHDWVLSLDADVVVPFKLKKEIKKAISSTKYSAYYIGRINNIWGKDIKHTDWGPDDDCHIWLYKKGYGSWQSLVHEEYLTDLPTGKLKNHLYHYNYNTVKEFIQKINSYSKLASLQGQQFPCYWPLRDYLKRYFYKLGFLDGYHGLFLSYLQAIYYHTLKVKNWQKQYV